MWRVYRPQLQISEDYRVYEIQEPFQLRFVRVDGYDGQLEFAIPVRYAKSNKAILKVSDKFHLKRERDVYRLYSKDPDCFVSMCSTKTHSICHILEKVEELFDLTHFLPRNIGPIHRCFDIPPSHCAAYCIGIPAVELSNFASVIEKRVAPIVPTNTVATVFAMLKAVADEVVPQPTSLSLLKHVEIDANHTSELINMLRLATFMEEDSARLYLELAMEDWWIAEKVYFILEWMVPLFPRYCTIVNAVDILEDIAMTVRTAPRYLDNVLIAERVLQRCGLLCMFEDSGL